MDTTASQYTNREGPQSVFSIVSWTKFPIWCSQDCDFESLVPKAYKQQFRNSHKEDYTEFARKKEVQFDRWCASKEVNLDFNKLHQLILLEEFKSCLFPFIKTYLDERNPESLHQAAVLAEDYSWTHKGAFSRDVQNSAGLKSTHNVRGEQLALTRLMIHASMRDQSDISTYHSLLNDWQS